MFYGKEILVGRQISTHFSNGRRQGILSQNYKALFAY